ncbi:MAG TPA: glutathione S-transferase N-terminal domain-containing protein [Nevskiaceae bacterium]|nr:glutathione S-transferase N-terminal domain-containing protein [Nevskiaceae bacterium]
MSPARTLYTFSISHFSEKVRWALDASRLPYREVPRVPLFHVLDNAWLTRGEGVTVPILQEDGRVIRDSSRILRHLVETEPQALRPLLPRAASARQRLLEALPTHDALGVAVLRLAYGATLDQPEVILRLWSLDAAPWQRRLLALALPRLRGLLARRFRLDRGRLARAQDQVRRALDQLAREHLARRRLDLDSITRCALLAPLAGPAEHRCYGDPAFQAPLRPALGELLEHPGLAEVRAVYRRYRRAPIAEPS